MNSLANTQAGFKGDANKMLADEYVDNRKSMVSASHPPLRPPPKRLAQVDLSEQMQLHFGCVERWPSCLWSQGGLQEGERNFSEILFSRLVFHEIVTWGHLYYSHVNSFKPKEIQHAVQSNQMLPERFCFLCVVDPDRVAFHWAAVKNASLLQLFIILSVCLLQSVRGAGVQMLDGKGCWNKLFKKGKVSQETVN